MVRLRSPAPYGGFPERPKGADCKSVVTDFGGPNPPSPTRKKPSRKTWLFSMKRAWRMNHEAGLRPMKCAVGTWRRGRASLHVPLAEHFMATATCCGCHFISRSDTSLTK